MVERKRKRGIQTFWFLTKLPPLLLSILNCCHDLLSPLAATRRKRKNLGRRHCKGKKEGFGEKGREAVWRERLVGDRGGTVGVL